MRIPAEHLPDTRDYLEKIIKSIGDPIFLTDSACRLILVNDAECELAGCRREALIGTTDHDFLPPGAAILAGSGRSGLSWTAACASRGFPQHRRGQDCRGGIAGLQL